MGARVYTHLPGWQPLVLGGRSEGQGEHPVAEPSGAVTVTVTWERYPRTAAADPDRAAPGRTRPWTDGCK